MQIQRRFTRDLQHATGGVAFHRVDIEICHSDETLRCCVTDFEVPSHWSVEACETLAQLYVRRTGVPAQLKAVEEEGVPSWLWRHVADEDALKTLPENERFAGEHSVKQVVHRIAGAWTYWGWTSDYFDTEADAKAFYDEVVYLLVHQMAAPNSPQWFNTGLYWAYGIEGPAQGHYYVTRAGKLAKSKNAYERPQVHACFIQGIADDLVNEGGIMDLWQREARVFKYGSGTGTNFSAIRGQGEAMSGGAPSWGLMRFLEMGDKAAAGIQSAGLSRPAGKAATLDIDHPDIAAFIRWKPEEEFKAASLIHGALTLQAHLQRVLEALRGKDVRRFDPLHNAALASALDAARRARVPESTLQRVLQAAAQGQVDGLLPHLSGGLRDEAFRTVSAHQAKLSVRMPNRFMVAMEQDEVWPLTRRSDNSTHSTVRARGLFEQIAQASWSCGDPAVQFDTTINQWHTCPKGGKIRASNPGGEFLFLDDTASCLASLNLARFVDAEGNFDHGRFTHAVRLLTVALDISTSWAQFPSKRLARRTADFRPIGIGFANLGALLVSRALAYDSEEARALGAGIAALLTGAAYLASAELAKEHGAFAAFTENRDDMLNVLKHHRRAARSEVEDEEWMGSGQALHAKKLPDSAMVQEIFRLWDLALVQGAEYGFRHAQVSCIAPTRTLARVMDCDSLGLSTIETLTRQQRTRDGAWHRQLSPLVLKALEKLGYGPRERDDIARYVLGHATLRSAPGVDHAALKARGFGASQLEAVEDALGEAEQLAEAFDPWLLGEQFCRRTLGLSDEQMHDASFDLLAFLGFDAASVDAACRYACGARTLEGAPHLKEEHLPVFDMARSAERSRRCLSLEAQLRMVASVQPFISGGIAGSVQLPHRATIAECSYALRLAWMLGLKTVSLLREGAALSEAPLFVRPARSEREEPEPVFQEVLLA